MRPRWIAVSLALHVAFVLVLLEMYSGFVFGDPAPERVSDIIAVALPAGGPASELPPPPARAPRVDRTYSINVPRASTAAPPASAPPPPTGGGADSGAARGVPNGTGGLALGPVRGDSRLWVGPMYVPEGGGRPIDMDSVVRGRLTMMAGMADSLARLDSLAPNRNPYATPSWVFERNGKKYGIDANAIHFGSFSIPTAVLALLNVPQGNIDQARANARLNDMRGEILRAAARAEAEDDFRRAVAQIRERKERERFEDRRRRDAERARNRDNDRPIP
jgi:hypothetical protein